MAGEKRPKRAKRRRESPSTPRPEKELKDGSPLQPSTAIVSSDSPANLPDSYSPKMMKAICDSIAGGVSMSHSLRLLGKRKELEKWRKAAPDYIDGLLAEAESRFVEKNIKRIDKAADKSWQAAAWLLERRYPSQFSAGVARGKQKAGDTKNYTVIQVISSVPRSRGVMRVRGKQVGEPGTPPDDIEAEMETIDAEILRVASNVPRRNIEESAERSDDDA